MSTVSPNAIGIAQELPLFEGLERGECAEILSFAHERRFAKHQTIFRQGDSAKFVLVMLSGRVKTIETSHTGAEVILSVDDAGDVVGGVGLSPSDYHTRSAQALERCHMLAWEAQMFRTLCERYPTLALNSLRILGCHLRILEQRFQELATERAAPRLALTLVRLLEQNGNGAPNAAPIALSHEELAQMTGMTPFTVSRLLSEWEVRDIVASQRKSLLVKDFSGLRVLAKGA
jgi:CRP-like cAMP-binding protein